MVQVVVHTPDVVGERMAGPGIRATHLARELAKHFPTTLIAKRESPSPGAARHPLPASGARDDRESPSPRVRGEGGPERSEGTDEGPLILQHNAPAARAALRDADVLIGQPARGFRKRRSGQRIIHDLFDPTVLELRELYGNAPSLRQRVHLAAEWYRLGEALVRADLLVCGAARQREFYEQLQAGEAPWIEVPFGIDRDELRACEKPRDNIVVWGGGLWEWLDAATAVDAIVRVNESGVRAKLLFLGRARPNRSAIDRRRDDRIDALLARGGAHVSANEDWVPYRERLSWLQSGKIAIMLHRRTAEADYSIRTRLFDAIATATPIVATAGGFAAQLVGEERLGIVVPPGDADAVAEAIRTLLTDDEMYDACVEHLERIQPRFAWDVVTRPLVDAILKWRM